ncbi:3-oxoacyl-[acyl-carrier-protein] reductase FabG [Capillimicrobium parvum]|uniref:3-oxoacyl-[acyl-carrier-protein] reductase FabG n=1 Tax=Capillimicrobium parvum TaxID=2884022 RepID=A0A9E6XWX6_9ACTN|nr:3-oxoacyl-[acyl-carrier-protein] reductase FabG [Capillimicrobium parvum]
MVTGAANGIGRAVALGLAAHGAAVVATDLDGEGCEAVVAASDGRVLAVESDVSDPASVEGAADRTLEWGGRIDALVHCAAVVLHGVDEPRRPWDQWRDVDWDVYLSVNVQGAWNVCRSVAPHMAAQGYGKIVLFSSQAVGAPPALLAPYTASKAAVIGLMRSLAVEVGDKGIRVNAIAPGLILTDRVCAGLTDDYGEAQRARTPLGRLGAPEDLVGPVMFFVSEQSDFVTGQVLTVDGGMVFAL